MNDLPTKEQNSRLGIRDIVAIGILDAVFVAVYWTCGMTFGMIPAAWPFLTAIAAVPSGVVLSLLLAKVPKRGTYAITGIVVSLVFLASGSWWPMVAIFAASGLLVDLYYASGDTRNARRVARSYAFFTLGFTVAAYLPLALWTERYLAINDATKYGLSADYFEPALRIFKGPLALLVVAAAIVGAYAGAALGRSILKKHFEKAGIA